ncbi:MAG: mechanosensitive ion channel [Novosphingobium sp.]|nr:mechanosensitive ion channel [Novosphingobium sp.]
MNALLADSTALLQAGIVAAIAIAAALAVHVALFALLRRVARLSWLASDAVVFARLRQPMRFAMVAIALSLAAEGEPLLAQVWGKLQPFVTPALLGWVAFALVKAFAEVLENRAVQTEDAIAVRSRRTRIAIVSRTIAFVIVFVTIALMLFAIPGVRNIGATLMASAGLAGLAIGAAAQPALKSLIAGMQIALTEPIRIDDYVVIEGESGRVEDIRMSYVVIRTADERRLIVPTTKFLDASFQNWTRVGGGITGAVVLPVMPGIAIAPLREAFLGLLATNKDWDRGTGALQVSEIRVDSVELKLVMSAHEPGALGRLRLAMREAMLEWLREHCPDALILHPAPSAPAASKSAPA